MNITGGKVGAGHALEAGAVAAGAPQIATSAGVVTLVPDVANIVVLPQGAALDDLTVVGRDIIVTLDDGRVYTIPDGAIYVPEIVIDGVEVPPLNLAALLNGLEPEPAVGAVQSSGGNFADPAGPMQAAHGLGDLLPYTELSFPVQQQKEIFPAAADETPAVIIGGPDLGPAVEHYFASVDEAGLPADRANGNVESPGSSQGDGSDTISGTVHITSQDPIKQITINGAPLTGEAGQQIVTSIGVLTLGPLVNGTISYTYVLTDNTSGDITADHFTVVVTDIDGQSGEAYLTIDVIDDVPVARPDVASVAEGGSVSGVVMVNDTQGADGAKVTGAAHGTDASAPVSGGADGSSVIHGTFGDLVIDAKGAWTYTSHPNAVPPAGAIDSFVYTLTDGDGDTSTTTLVIDLTDSGLVATSETGTVSEAALATGSNPASTAETATGTLADNTSGGEGALTYSLVGPGTGSHGTLVLNPDGNWSYTLTAPVDGAGAGGNTVPGIDSFTYRVTDANGNTTTGTLVIDAVDDVPVARPDMASVAEGGSVSGVVMVNDTQGADGAKVTGAAHGTDASAPVSGGADGSSVIHGTYGDLVIDANGAWTYTSHPNAVPPAGAIDSFVYTLTDGDGDTSTTTLVIDLTDAGMISDDQRVLVSESALDIFTKGNDLGHGTISGTQASSPLETATGQLNVSGVGVTYTPQSITSAYGLFELKADGSYTYTLTKNYLTSPATNNGAAVESGKEVFSYTATDAHGNSVTGTIEVDIRDDIPVAATPEAITLTNAADSSAVAWLDTDHSLSSNWGADGAGKMIFTAESISSLQSQHLTSGGSEITYSISEKGRLLTATNADDGSVVFHISLQRIASSSQYEVFLKQEVDGTGNVDGKVDFTVPVSIEDRDGDIVPSNQLDIHLEPDVTLSPDNQRVIVCESALDMVTSGNDLGHGSVTGSSPGLTVETATGQLHVAGNGVTYAAQSIASAYGLFELNADGSYTYTLTKPYSTSPSADNGPTTEAGKEVFTYTATDTDGNAVTGTITVDIRDDVPVARADTAGVFEGGTVSGNVTANDSIGADTVLVGSKVTGVATGSNAGASVSGQVGTSVQGAHGTLTLNGDGSWTYHAKANGLSANSTDSFVYTITDADGDTATSTLVINLCDVTLNPDNQRVLVCESALDTCTSGDDLGHGKITGTNPHLTVETATGQLHVAGDGVTYTPQSITSTYGLFELHADGSYTYTLTKNYLTSPAKNDGPAIEAGKEVFTYTATDAHGNSVTGTISVDIRDDVPVAATPESIVLTNVGCATATAYLDTDQSLSSNWGADGAGKMIFTSETIASLESQNLMAGHVALAYEITGQGRTLTAYKSSDHSVVFTIALQPSGQADIYKVSIVQTVESQTSHCGDENPLDFSVPVSIEDRDGDVVASNAIHVHLNPGVAPIALDLDGNGVQYLDLFAGVTFDYASDGHAERTAWVAGNDGLLAHANADGSLQIAFADGSDETDLQAVAAQFDSNADGLLTVADNAFGDFGVWQDVNSNGVVDAGEFRSLGEMGIAKINLVATGPASVEAGGDVVVSGTGQFTMNGATYVLGDAAFATNADNRIAARTTEIAAVSMAAGLFAVEAAQAHALPVAAVEAVTATVRSFAMQMPGVQADVVTSSAQYQEWTRPEASSDEVRQVEPAHHSTGEQQMPVGGHPLNDLVFAENQQAQVAEADGSDHAGSHIAALTMGSDANLMQALLMAAQADKGVSGDDAKADSADAGSLPAIQETFAENAGNQAVDALIEHFAGHDGHLAMGQATVSEHSGIEQLLGAQLAGVGFDGLHVNMMGGLDEAALAAVQAHPAAVA